MCMYDVSMHVYMKITDIGRQFRAEYEIKIPNMSSIMTRLKSMIVMSYIKVMSFGFIQRYVIDYCCAIELDVNRETILIRDCQELCWNRVQ